MRWVKVAVACAFVAPLGVIVACGSNKTQDRFVVPYDAGIDAPIDATNDAALDPTLGGPCTDDSQCDDQIACTYDSCDQTLKRCRNTPDDTQCQNNVYCDGHEVCIPRQGCAAGAVVTCEDGDPCTIDTCVESSQSCSHAPRDVDQDSDPDSHCVANHDCNDTDPTVSSLHAEVCANNKDDNCNGIIDETPCSTASYDTCATALAITAPGTFLLSTVADAKNYATGCDVTVPAAAQDIVAAITVPGTTAMDLSIWASAQGSEIALSLETTCGSGTGALACGHAISSVHGRVLGRSLAPGTYFLVATTQGESAVDVRVDFLPPTTPPTNETCASPEAIATDTPVPVSIVDATKDLASGCTTTLGELTYAFTLAQASDVHIFASATDGDGTPVVSLRAPDCTDELRCRTGNDPPLFARNLAPGTYVVSVSATSPVDATLLVQTSAPTIAPPQQTCTAPPAAPLETTFTVDLSNEEDAIHDGCYAGVPNAAYELVLTQPSDVLVVGRFPIGDLGAVAIDGIDCTPAEQVACTNATTPVRVSKRNLPAGTYRIVVAEEHGLTSTLTVMVRPTIPPVNVTTADNCGDTIAIPATGGFFTGDTSKALADFPAGCDEPGGPTNGAPDQILGLTLTTQTRMVFDMTGSTYATILDIRESPTCPGTEVPNACYVGTSGPSRSFLDLTLDAGQYWVQIDGFAGDAGIWNLDVRALAP